MILGVWNEFLLNIKRENEIKTKENQFPIYLTKNIKIYTYIVEETC